MSTEQNERKPSPLAAKMAEVMAEMNSVPKNGRNNFFGYDYVQETDLVAALRQLLADRQVVILPSVVDHGTVEITDNRNRTNYLATVTLEVTFVDAESGEQRSTFWVGQGTDSGDKSYYKAYTGAMKYCLMKTFLVSTGDDPERDDQEGQAKPQRKQSGGQGSGQRRSSRPARPQQKPRGTSAKREPKGKTPAQKLERCVYDANAYHAKAFLEIYCERMGAEKIGQVEDDKLTAMLRKLMSMNAVDRKGYIYTVVTDHEDSAPATDEPDTPGTDAAEDGEGQGRPLPADQGDVPGIKVKSKAKR